MEERLSVKERIVLWVVGGTLLLCYLMVSQYAS